MNLPGRDLNRTACSSIEAKDMIVTIYTTSYCGYCQRAEELLRRRGIAYRKVDVTTDAQAREDLVERANGRRTVPVIFFDDRAIGGYTELAAMDARGELAAAVGPGSAPVASASPDPIASSAPGAHGEKP